MSYFEFPHTRTYDNDLGWLIKHVKELIEEFDRFVALNEIKFADPADWNITAQYPKNTIVLDQYGNAYLSLQPVPSGIELDNTDYWQLIMPWQVFQRQHNYNIVNRVSEIAPMDVEKNTIIHALGYYDPFDFGEAVYYVTDTVYSGFYTIELDNGLHAYQIFNRNNSIEAYGYQADTDATPYLNTAALYLDTVNLKSDVTYHVNRFEITKPFTLNGNGCNIVTDNSTNTIAFYVHDCENVDLNNFTVDMCYRAISIYNVTNIKLSNMEITSRQFAITLEKTDVFDIRNIIFSQDTNVNTNADGVHFYAGCSNGYCSNLTGYTNDDFIALNAHEQEHGTVAGITRITFENLITRNSIRPCYCAVRVYSQSSARSITYIKFNNCTLVSDQVPPIRIVNNAGGTGDSTLGLCYFQNIEFENCLIRYAGNPSQSCIVRCGYSSGNFLRFKNCRFSNGGTVNYIHEIVGGDISRLIYEECTFEGTHPNNYYVHIYNAAINDLFVNGCIAAPNDDVTRFLSVSGANTAVQRLVVSRSYFAMFAILSITGGHVANVFVENTHLNHAGFTVLIQSGGNVAGILLNNVRQSNTNAFVRIGKTLTERLDIAINGCITSDNKYIFPTDATLWRAAGIMPLTMAPGSPIAGDAYITPTTGVIHVYNGSEWV